jgi:predicted flap endonuclease-1-like 5' DNA nuclease
MASISKIEGIGPVYAGKLRQAGIRTTERLLAEGGSRKGRKQIAADCDISDELVLEWVNRADLMRVKGVGEQYSDLLEQAGVDTVKELATRRPDNLHAKCLTVCDKKKVVRRPPSVGEVERWVAHAKELKPAVSYR